MSTTDAKYAATPAPTHDGVAIDTKSPSTPALSAGVNLHDLINDPLLHNSAYMPLKFRALIRDALTSVAPPKAAESSATKPAVPVSAAYKSLNLWVELEHRMLDSYSEVTRAYSHLPHRLVPEMLRRLQFGPIAVAALYDAWVKRYPVAGTQQK